MPIQNNVDVMNAYDDGLVIVVPQIPTTDPLCHHAAHCLIFEGLRGWMRVGLGAFNNEETWDAVTAQVYADALDRVGLNPLSAEKALLLTANDKVQAAQMSENYFEHGYAEILNGVSVTDKRSFRRNDGISS